MSMTPKSRRNKGVGRAKIAVFSVSGAEPGTDIPEAAMTETA